MTKHFLLSIIMLLSTVMTASAKGIITGGERTIGDKQYYISFYSPSIVRVRVLPASLTLKERKSYSVILGEGQKLRESVKTQEADGQLRLASNNIAVSLNLSDGTIAFADSKGTTLLRTGKTSITPCTNAVDKGKFALSQTFRLQDDEAIYGLGQLRDTFMNQRGRDVEIWNHNTYISIPYFMSERGYGLYWDNAGRSRFTDNAEGTTFRSEVGPYVDYYFFYKDGTADGVIAAIRDLTGQATMLPQWATGFWQCRERYKTSDELTAVLDKHRELQIPLDGIVQDWQYWGCDSNWNAMDFMNPYYINKVNDPAWKKYLPGDMKNLPAQGEPRIKSPQAMVDYVHQHNAHLMITIWANFGPWTKAFADLKKINALLPFDTWPRNNGVMPYDVFNPEARNIYWRYLRNLYGMGLDAWWTDSTEPDHFEVPGDDDYMTFDGSWRSVKNAFSILHNRGIYEHQRAMKGNYKRSLQMTRSGAFGIQHYGTFSWSGDIIASWQEMKQQIPSGLNYTLCGIPYWNTDLGGFFYWEFDQQPTNPAIKELQTRWMEWGMFMPLMRNHCSSPMVSEIYLMGQDGDWAYDAIKKFIKLRYTLQPYIYSNVADCALAGGSMMRALVMDFAKDRHASRLNDEYLFGRNILVKPVTDPMYTWKDQQKKGHLIFPDVKKAAAPVTVYLPEGTQWFDFWTDERHDGGQTIDRLCPIDIMPVYLKAGTILPLGPDVQYTGEKSWETLDVKVYPGADGSFALYEDAGDGYGYERGAYHQTHFTYRDADRTLTITPDRHSFKGMLKSHTFRIRLVGTMQVKEVTVEEKPVTVQL